MYRVGYKLVGYDSEQTRQVKHILLHLNVLGIDQNPIALRLELEVTVTLETIIVKTLQDIHSCALDLAEENIQKVVNNVCRGLTVSDQS